jgi:D-alanyl-D-alanine carboxypeptidase
VGSRLTTAFMLAALTVLGLTGCAAITETAQRTATLGATTHTPGAGADLQGLLDAQAREQNILGMAMAARLADGTVVFKSSGTTDPAEETVWSLDTQSALGSITKTSAAVVIMQLVEGGSLSLDDTIETWFPG